MSSNPVQIVFWDVQHGHSTYIKTPNGRHIVIDLGIGDYDTYNKNFSPLIHLKNNYGVQQLDLVVITHPHLDHIDDILNFDALNPKSLLRPKQLTNSEIMSGVISRDRQKFDKYVEINNRYNSPVNANDMNNTQVSENWGGLDIKFFLPVNCKHDNFNNHSIVTVLKYAGIKIVIPGDNEQCSFEELFRQPGFVDAVRNSDVLLAPHHGRHSGYNHEFVTLANPRLTIVSDGRFCDTSANSRYSQSSRGWDVWKAGQKVPRKCLTTNSDGEVFVNFGPQDNGNNFLQVSIK
jgi:beta-lactamase superfamily II metal-dependent hydrolase